MIYFALVVWTLSGLFVMKYAVKEYDRHTLNGVFETRRDLIRLVNRLCVAGPLGWSVIVVAIYKVYFKKD